MFASYKRQVAMAMAGLALTGSLFLGGNPSMGAAAASAVEASELLPWSAAWGEPYFQAGAGLGYYIWQDNDGVHLRTTTEGRLHQFLGTIRSNGLIWDARRVRPEADDSLRRRPHQLDFSFRTADGLDGLDFQIDGGSEITFELYQDGVERPVFVHIGSTGRGLLDLPVVFDLSR